MQDRLYEAIKKFFALKDEVKKKYELADLAGQRGYTGKGKEHAKGRNTGDLKEFYHVGQELTTMLNWQKKDIHPTSGRRKFLNSRNIDRCL